MARRVPLQDPAAVIKCLEEDGGVIVTNFSSPQDVDQVNQDSRPYVEAMIREREAKSLPRETIRCPLLFGHSSTAREKWLQQPQLQQIINHFLRTEVLAYHYQHFPDSEYPDRDAEFSTNALFSAGATLEIAPGMPTQDLHRDEYIWQQVQKNKDCKERYEMGQDANIGILVPGVETTRENGATKFVPGSHLWPHSRFPKEEEAVDAEMKVGEALLFLGSTVHAGGGNASAQPRPVHGFFYCRSWMRPEENMYPWFTQEEVKTWSLSAQKQAGYILDNPLLGHTNLNNPIDAIRARGTVQAV